MDFLASENDDGLLEAVTLLQKFRYSIPDTLASSGEVSDL